MFFELYTVVSVTCILESSVGIVYIRTYYHVTKRMVGISFLIRFNALKRVVSVTSITYLYTDVSYMYKFILHTKMKKTLSMFNNRLKTTFIIYTKDALNLSSI